MTIKKASRSDTVVSLSSFHNVDEASPASPARRSIFQALVAIPLLGLASRKALAQTIDLFKTFQTPEAFISEVFAPDAAPAPQMLMLDAGKQSQVGSIMGHPFPQMRLRYWKAGGRSAWIFDDIGKEGYVPTTCGFVVSGGAIEQARVLIYRESRGEQIGEPSFLKQLIGAKAAGTGLDKSVDNISGATLSVKMMQRMARTAIAFDSMTA